MTLPVAVGIQTRVTRDGRRRYRGRLSVFSKRVYGPWRGTLEEAVEDREQLLAAYPRKRREVRVPSRGRPTIYFIQVGRDGPVKIGWTTGDPSARLESLQVAHYEELRLIGSMPGEHHVEQLIHAELADHRIRGEWFRPHPDVLAVAKEGR